MKSEDGEMGHHKQVRLTSLAGFRAPSPALALNYSCTPPQFPSEFLSSNFHLPQIFFFIGSAYSTSYLSMANSCQPNSGVYLGPAPGTGIPESKAH